MNNIAISPSIAMYALQNQNVERKIAKNIELTNTKSNTTNIDTIDIPSLQDQLLPSNLNTSIDTLNTIDTSASLAFSSL